jgi:hypothetical protein
MRLWDEPLTEEKKAEIVDKLATQVVKRGLSVPAVFFLEMHKPLCRVAANAAVMFSPFIIPFSGFALFDHYSQFLEERENIERLIRRIEEMTEEERAKKKETAHATR